MKYLLDADWSIDYLSGFRNARRWFPVFLQEGAAISVVTQIELYTGAYGSRDPRAALRQLRPFLVALSILPLDQRVMRRTARIRAHLLAGKAPIKHRAYDLVAAATALEYGLTMVTSNLRDYRDVPGLTILNPRTGQTHQVPS